MEKFVKMMEVEDEEDPTTQEEAREQGEIGEWLMASAPNHNSI